MCVKTVSFLEDLIDFYALARANQGVIYGGKQNANHLALEKCSNPPVQQGGGRPSVTVKGLKFPPPAVDVF